MSFVAGRTADLGMFLDCASLTKSPKFFLPGACPSRMYILLDGIPTFFATGRTLDNSFTLTNKRVAFDNFKA